MSDYVLHDKDIREPLFDFLEETFGKVRILEEKRMGSSRADLIMVTVDALVGLEIKSDADNYTRLKSQTADYDQYFDKNYVAVGSSHAFHIEEHVPAHWGIITIDPPKEGSPDPDFYILRHALPNPSLDRKKKLSLLWRPELAKIQELKAMPAYSGKSKEFVIDKILLQIPEEELRPLICDILFERDYTTIRDTINEYREDHGKKPRRKRKRRKYKAV